MLNFIKESIEPDVVLWSGDSVPHNIGTLTLESNVEQIKKVTQMVAEGLDGIRVYPTIGNHDTYPQDVISMQHPNDNEAINQWSSSWN